MKDSTSVKYSGRPAGLCKIGSGRDAIPEENRKFPRYAIEAAIEVSRDGAVIARGTTADLSRGGLSAVVDNAIPAGSEIEVSIVLVFDADTVSEPLVVSARVVWCTRLGGRHQLGTQFTPLQGEAAHFLDMFIRYLEQSTADEDAGPGAVDPFA